MSKSIFETSGQIVTVTSFCGPANTLERTRMRLQFDVYGKFPDNTLGFNEVRALRNALDRWITENDK